MANGFTYAINTDVAIEKLLEKQDKVESIVNRELNSFAINTVNDAKRLAPVDEGYLRNSISYAKANFKVTITVNADYAAYVEFGTKKFAAAYVAALPADWQTFAAQFKGKGGESFQQFIVRLTQWVHRKGLAGTYSVKTRERTGAKASHGTEDYSVAYKIALSILRNGIKAHPFLYPAFEKNRLELIANLKAQIEK